MPNPSEIERQEQEDALEKYKKKESKQAGQETYGQALLAVKKILDQTPSLKELVEKKSAPYMKLDRQQLFWTCPMCTDGHLHGVGHNILPNGHVVPGGLLICDTCGYYEGRR